jgi:hypothetical protein
MTSKLAYQVSYTTEYRDGHIEDHDMHTKFFATREQAVSHARHLTNDAADINGVFAGEWVTPFGGIIAAEDAEEIRVTATIVTVTISEIEESL